MTKMYSRYTSLLCLLFSCCYSNCVQAQDSAYEQPIEISFCENKIGAINFSRDQVKINLHRDFNSIDKLSANNLMRNVCYSKVKYHVFSSILNKTQQDYAHIDSLISCILTLEQSYDIYTNEILSQYYEKKPLSVKLRTLYAEAAFLNSIEVQHLLSLQKSTELQHLLSLQKSTELHERLSLNTDEYSKLNHGSIMQLEQYLSTERERIDKILSDESSLRDEIKLLNIDMNADFDRLRNLALKQKDTVINGYRDIIFETITVDELLQQLRGNDRYRIAVYKRLQLQINKKYNEKSIINSIEKIEHAQKQHCELSVTYQVEFMKISSIGSDNDLINICKSLLDIVETFNIVEDKRINEQIKDRIKALSYYEYGLQTQS